MDLPEYSERGKPPDAMVRDIELPANCTLAAIIRKDEVLAVRGETVLQACSPVPGYTVPF